MWWLTGPISGVINVRFVKEGGEWVLTVQLLNFSSNSREKKKHSIQHLLLVVVTGGTDRRRLFKDPIKSSGLFRATIRLSHWGGSEHEIALHPAHPSPHTTSHPSMTKTNHSEMIFTNKHKDKYKFRDFNQTMTMQS